MPKKKHLPIRTCVFCGKKLYKRELFRFVYLNGDLILDEKQVLPGRGCYLCKICFEKREEPKVRKKLKRALRIGEDL